MGYTLSELLKLNLCEILRKLGIKFVMGKPWVHNDHKHYECKLCERIHSEKL
jgi:hypothetical protein